MVSEAGGSGDKREGRKRAWERGMTGREVAGGNTRAEGAQPVEAGGQRRTEQGKEVHEGKAECRAVQLQLSYYLQVTKLQDTRYRLPVTITVDLRHLVVPSTSRMVGVLAPAPLSSSWEPLGETYYRRIELYDLADTPLSQLDLDDHIVAAARWGGPVGTLTIHLFTSGTPRSHSSDPGSS